MLPDSFRSGECDHPATKPGLRCLHVRVRYGRGPRCRMARLLRVDLRQNHLVRYVSDFSSSFGSVCVCVGTRDCVNEYTFGFEGACECHTLLFLCAFVCLCVCVCMCLWYVCFCVCMHLGYKPNPFVTHQSLSP